MKQCIMLTMSSLVHNMFGNISEDTFNLVMKPRSDSSVLSSEFQGTWERAINSIFDLSFISIPRILEARTYLFSHGPVGA